MPIRVLSPETVGKIAAGEVVERPMSVAKELIENALDAGATSINIEAEDGGTTYLRITDNGCGIAPNEVRMVFENHATSKIIPVEPDLTDIRTLGFRGEAMPSIAAVAKVELTTRRKNAPSGVRIKVEGSEFKGISDVGCPEGTTVVVRDLFYNTPVRKAFLKRPATEMAALTDIVSKMILGNPEISFRFLSKGKTVYHSYGDGNLKHAAHVIFGKETAEKLIPVDITEGGLRLKGLIGINDCARPTRHQYFFVNGRSIRCAMLQEALESSLRGRVTIGMFPMCILSLTLPPSSVDVNVHPSKLEVRFRDETSLRLSVENMMTRVFENETMLNFEEIAEKETGHPEKKLVVKAFIPDEIPVPIENAKANESNLKREESPEIPKPMYTVREAEPLRTLNIRQFLENDTVKQEPASEKKARVDIPANFPKADSPASEIKPKNEPVAPLVNEQVSLKIPELPENKVSYRIIGVLFATYILLEVADKFVMIDQHAAHERIRYETYKKMLDQKTATQYLLTPVVIRLSKREVSVLMDNQELLKDAGYELEPFGENDIQLRSVPHILGKAEMHPLFLDLIDSLERLKTSQKEAKLDEIIQLSCKKAVKGGDVLSDLEIRILIDEMMKTGAAQTCPHGRPVAKIMSKREIETMFKRIQ